MLDARRSLDQVTAKLLDICGAFGKLLDVSGACFANFSDFGWIVSGAGGIGVFFCGFGWILAGFLRFLAFLSGFWVIFDGFGSKKAPGGAQGAQKAAWGGPGVTQGGKRSILHTASGAQK